MTISHVEQVRQHTIKEAAENQRSIPYYKLQATAGVVDRNRIRFLPPFVEGDMYYRTVTVAYRVGPNRKFIIPGDETNGQNETNNPYWAYIAKLRASSNPADKELLRQIGPVKQYQAWVLDRNAQDNMPKLFGMNWNTLQKFNGYMIDPQIGDFTDPHQGRDFRIIYKDKSGGATAKIEDIRIDFSTSSLGVDWNELKKNNQWEKYRVGKPMEADYLQAILDGTEQQYLEDRRNRAAFGDDQTAPWEQDWKTAGQVLNTTNGYPDGITDTTKMYVVVGGKAQEIAPAKICEELGNGNDLLCTDGKRQWAKASAMGFRFVPPTPPQEVLPPIPTEPELPPLPTEPSVAGSLTDPAFLQQQLSNLASDAPKPQTSAEQLEALLNA